MYMVFDIEAVTDLDKIARTEGNPGEDPQQTVFRVMEKAQSEAESKDKPVFIPARYHKLVSFAAVVLDHQGNYKMHDFHTASDDPNDLTKRFCQLLNFVRNENGRLVSFNGTGYDMPVIESHAIEFGHDIKDWFVMGGSSYTDPRYPFNPQDHIDLCKYISKSFAFGGGLSYWCRLLGLPGKIETSGGSVERLIHEDPEKVSQYCMTDVLNTTGLALAWLGRCGWIDHPNHPFTERMLEVVDKVEHVGGEVQIFADMYRKEYEDRA